MNSATIETLSEVLATIDDRPQNAWVYLAKDEEWGLASKSAVMESEEVPAGLEDEPDAGVPEFAKQNNLIQVLPVSVLQDVVANARAQRNRVAANDLLRAFLFYYRHDAFIVFTNDSQ
jgi:hypothetical protein